MMKMSEKEVVMQVAAALALASPMDPKMRLQNTRVLNHHPKQTQDHSVYRRYPVTMQPLQKGELEGAVIQEGDIEDMHHGA